MIFTDTIQAGTITTQNLNPNSGVATASSTVLLDTRGDSTATVQVTGVYTGALTPQVTVDGINWIALGATALLNANTGAYAATISSAATGIWQVDVSGFAYFRISANAAVTGTATVSLRGTATDGMFALDAPIPTGANVIGTVNLSGATTNNTSTSSLNAAATTNATSVKASAGAVFNLSANNASAAAKYVRLYNKASAPTVGTDTPIAVITIPASASKEVYFGDLGLRFSTGISYAITGGAPVLDATALAAGDVQLAIGWL